MRLTWPQRRRSMLGDFPVAFAVSPQCWPGGPSPPEPPRARYRPVAALLSRPVQEHTSGPVRLSPFGSSCARASGTATPDVHGGGTGHEVTGRPAEDRPAAGPPDGGPAAGLPTRVRSGTP